MADEVVYRLIAGEGITLTEDSGTRTVTASVPGLSQKINIGDIGQASTASMGLVELADDGEVQAMTDDNRVVTAGGLGAAAQSSATDSATGRLLKVGAFGLGADVPLISAGDLGDMRPSGIYHVLANMVTGAPSGAGNGILYDFRATSLYKAMVYVAWTRRVFIAAINNGSGAAGWTEIFGAHNFDPTSKANTSGAYPGLDVGNSATVGGQTAAMLAPPGKCDQFAMSVAPAGWLKANGAAVSRTTYAALFANIGTQWGAGNGSTTFNLPDLRGEFGRGWDDGRGLDTSRAFGTVQSSQNLSHAHAINSVGDHTHDISGGGGTELGSFIDTTSQSISQTVATGAAGAHTHTMNADGGSEARPRNVALLWCIKF